MSRKTIHNLINLGEMMEVSDFLRDHGSDDFKWFSDSLSKAKAIHRKKKTKKKLNAADRTQLKQAYNLIGRDVQDSDPLLFQELVPPHEFKAWLNHSVEIFRQISEDRQWMKTGTLLPYELSFLQAQVTLMHVAVPAVMAFETDFFQALASFVAARRGASNNAPSAEISDLITFLVRHVLQSCANKWKPEKVFKKLEATGVLDQFLFCSAISRDDRADVAIREIHGELLLKCPAFVAKIFKKGTPCGDTTRAILCTDRGHKTYRHVAIQYLHALVRLSWAMQHNHNIQACQCCKSSSPSKDFQSKLMQCSRCRLVYYCSKECQTSDWKKHRKTCKCLAKRLSKSGPEKKDPSESLLNLFTQTNYVHIMKALVMECDKSGEQKKDMVIEVSFVPDSTGKIPALQDPPEFRIVPFKRYFDGSRLLESDGILKSNYLATQREEIEPQILRCLKNNESYLSPSSLLYICNHVTSASVLAIEQEQSQIHSQEAVDAFRLAMNENDFGPIADICRGDDKIMDLLRVQMGMPDDENIAPNAL